MRHQPLSWVQHPAPSSIPIKKFKRNEIKAPEVVHMYYRLELGILLFSFMPYADLNIIMVEKGWEKNREKGFVSIAFQ